jgi:tRNA pseudouridine55 synthase
MERNHNNGLLVIDKPGGMTSRDVVNHVQQWFPRKTKIGHTGTLDPLATGVLVVCIGAATRLADYVQAMSKSYASRFRLGATSSTDDADGVVVEQAVQAQPARERIDQALASFEGVIEQVPPAVSAVKVSGRRAHALARQGRDVQLSARRVRIVAIRVTAYEWPWLDVEVDCGKGTYIRSIARDLGAALGCGGLVQTLRRTRIGAFLASDGVRLDGEPTDLKLQPMTAAVAGLPQLRIDGDEARSFCSGRAIRAGSELPAMTEAAILNESGELIGVAEAVRGMLQPKLVLKV